MFCFFQASNGSGDAGADTTQKDRSDSITEQMDGSGSDTGDEPDPLTQKDRSVAEPEPIPLTQKDGSDSVTEQMEGSGSDTGDEPIPLTQKDGSDSVTVPEVRVSYLYQGDM